MNAPQNVSNQRTASDSPKNWLELISQPTDELEQLALLEAGKKSRAGAPVAMLQVDCGNALLGLRLAKNGATVLAVDSDPATGLPLKEAALALGVTQNFRYQIWDASHCLDTTPLPGAPFDIVACPHSLSHLAYTHAHTLLRRLALMTKIGGKLFISAYGLHSELGEDYAGESERVRDRFSALSPSIADKYGIHQPVCLYSERDLFLLIFEAGLSVVKTFTTTHGNVRAIAVRV